MVIFYKKSVALIFGNTEAYSIPHSELRKQCNYDMLFQVAPALGGVEPNAVLCKTCSVLLCVLEQPRVDNCSAGPNWRITGPDCLDIIFP